MIHSVTLLLPFNKNTENRDSISGLQQEYGKKITNNSKGLHLLPHVLSESSARLKSMNFMQESVGVWRKCNRF